MDEFFWRLWWISWPKYALSIASRVVITRSDDSSRGKDYLSQHPSWFTAGSVNEPWNNTFFICGRGIFSTLAIRRNNRNQDFLGQWVEINITIKLSYWIYFRTSGMKEIGAKVYRRPSFLRLPRGRSLWEREKNFFTWWFWLEANLLLTEWF